MFGVARLRGSSVWLRLGGSFYGALQMVQMTTSLSPVAMQSLTCTGAELSVAECEWSAPDAACSSHGSDSVVFCTGGAMEPQVARFVACGDVFSRRCVLHTLRWDRCACCPEAARQASMALEGLKCSCLGSGPLCAARVSQMAQPRLRANRWFSLALSRRGAVAYKRVCAALKRRTFRMSDAWAPKTRCSRAPT